METKDLRYTIIINCDYETELPCKVILQLVHPDDDIEVLVFAYDRYKDIQPDLSKYELKKSKNLEINPVHFNLASRAIAYSEEYN